MTCEHAICGDCGEPLAAASHLAEVQAERDLANAIALANQADLEEAMRKNATLATLAARAALGAAAIDILRPKANSLKREWLAHPVHDIHKSDEACNVCDLVAAYDATSPATESDSEVRE